MIGNRPNREAAHSAAAGGGLDRDLSSGGGWVATVVLIHGAGDAGWYWHLVEAELRARGHDAVSPDLPCDDGSAGLPEYADTVAGAIGGRTNLIVVAQPLGGFTAPLVCDRVAMEHPRAEPPARAGGAPRGVRRWANACPVTTSIASVSSHALSIPAGLRRANRPRWA